jgi:DNA-binding phage protein
MITTSLWDASEHLESDDDMVLYLEAAFEEGDPALISAVLRDIAGVIIRSGIVDK